MVNSMGKYAMFFLTTFVATQLLMTSTVASDNNANSPITASGASAHLDHSAFLRCHLKTDRHGRGWFLIWWYKMQSNGQAVEMVHLTAREKVPVFSSEFPYSMEGRVLPIITIEFGYVEFNLKISSLTCSDEGEYRCSVISLNGESASNAELRVYASPRPPSITANYLPPNYRGNITVECKADVGLPPKMLVWYKKPPSAQYFTLMDMQPDEIQETSGCHVTSTRKLNINVSPATQGTSYRCGYPGYIEKEGMYDELVVQVENLGVEDIREEPKSSAVCAEGTCDDYQNQRPNDAQATDSDNEARAFHSCPYYVIISCLLALFLAPRERI